MSYLCGLSKAVITMLFYFLFSLFVNRIESSDWGIKTLSSVYALKDHTAYLDCEFSFPEDHSFTAALWYKDRYYFFCRSQQYFCSYYGIVNDPRVSISEDISTRRNCTLTINNVKLSDNGEYSFTFYTLRDRYRRPGPRLHVNARPENLTLSVPSVLQAGNQTTLTCSVHNVYPSESASLQFESDGIEGTTTQQTQGSDDGTYVKTVTFTFTTQYFHNRKNLSCSVAHPNLTHTLQANVTLDIKYGPRNVSVLVSPSGTIKEGDGVVLWCGADSNPGVSRYSWYKQPAGSSSWVGVTGSEGAELRIPFASRADSGHYRCIAENGDGEASRATSLDVQYPPDTMQVSPCDNRSLCWVCEVEANPVANLTWLEDGAAGRRLMSGGELLHNGTRTRLKIQMTQEKEALICAAVNSHGQKQEVKTISKKGGMALNTIIPTVAGTLAAFITAVAGFCFVRGKGRETGHRDSSTKASPEVIYDVVQNLTEDQEPVAKVSIEEEELVYADLDLAPGGERNWKPVPESELTEYSDIKTLAWLKAEDMAASQE
ncbi:sialic acid-binding Ig-like lectin 10 [Polyodon spathula]|uniref:sialic acid-binding Ig-like lectin 10 n=1 Tax=Polyodon spathula TaxID=7913 RepID=UPI001B7E328A|nr:sialic acid-binding Ig-like lectin 10 [Polyodon spathula]